VFFSPRFNLWVVTRYDDVWTVLKDPARFSSAQSTAVSATRIRSVSFGQCVGEAGAIRA
jgi:cytochrome P450